MPRTITTTLIVKITANTILAFSYERITRHVKPRACFAVTLESVDVFVEHWCFIGHCVPFLCVMEMKRPMRSV